MVCDGACKKRQLHPCGPLSNQRLERTFARLQAMVSPALFCCLEEAVRDLLADSSGPGCRALFPPGTPKALLQPRGPELEREAVSWFRHVYPQTQAPDWPAAKPIDVIQVPLHMASQHTSQREPGEKEVQIHIQGRSCRAMYTEEHRDLLSDHACSKAATSRCLLT